MSVSRRLQRIFEYWKEDIDGPFLELSKVGRHFWAGNHLIVVARNEQESYHLRSLIKAWDYKVELLDIPGPTTLVRCHDQPTADILELAAMLTARYSKCNPLGKNPSDVWEIPNVKANHVEKTIHPCQFPVELIERLVLALTDEGDWVLDPFIGVGTTAIAALMHGRRAIGAEIVPEYVKIAKERIYLAEKGELRIRPMEREVYDPSSGESNIPPQFVCLKGAENESSI